MLSSDITLVGTIFLLNMNLIYSTCRQKPLLQRGFTVAPGQDELSLNKCSEEELRLGCLQGNP